MQAGSMTALVLRLLTEFLDIRLRSVIIAVSHAAGALACRVTQAVTGAQ